MKRHEIKAKIEDLYRVKKGNSGAYWFFTGASMVIAYFCGASPGMLAAIGVGSLSSCAAGAYHARTQAIMVLEALDGAVARIVTLEQAELRNRGR